MTSKNEPRSNDTRCTCEYPVLGHQVATHCAKHGPRSNDAPAKYCSFCGALRSFVYGQCMNSDCTARHEDLKREQRVADNAKTANTFPMMMLERPSKGRVRIIVTPAAMAEDEQIEVDEAWLRDALGGVKKAEAQKPVLIEKAGTYNGLRIESPHEHVFYVKGPTRNDSEEAKRDLRELVSAFEQQTDYPEVIRKLKTVLDDHARGYAGALYTIEQIATLVYATKEPPIRR